MPRKSHTLTSRPIRTTGASTSRKRESLSEGRVDEQHYDVLLVVRRLEVRVALGPGVLGAEVQPAPHLVGGPQPEAGQLVVPVHAFIVVLAVHAGCRGRNLAGPVMGPAHDRIRGYDRIAQAGGGFTVGPGENEIPFGIGERQPLNLRIPARRAPLVAG